MKYYILLAASLFSLELQSMEREIQFENQQIKVAKVKVLPYEEIGLHRDALPRIIVPLQGGTITRLETDGTTNEVTYTTGTAVYREADPAEMLHRSVNKSSEPIELIVIQFKTNHNE